MAILLIGAINPCAKAGAMRFPVRAILAALSILALMSGTAVRAQQLPDLKALVAAFDGYNTCAKAIVDDPQYSDLKKHGGWVVEEFTLENLTDPQYATDAEIALLYSMHPKRQVCTREMVDQLSKLMPVLATIWTDASVQYDTLLVALVKKKITWGDHQMRVRDVILDRKKKVEGEFANLNAAYLQADENAKQASQDEERRRWEALGRLGQSLQNQEPHRPQITNCSRFYNNVTCTSN